MIGSEGGRAGMGGIRGKGIRRGDEKPSTITIPITY